MTFTPTKIEAVWVVEMERRQDERGWFARTWCTDEFRKNNLNPNLSQCSASFNHRRGTLRGLHYQIAPHEEAKLVRCTRGAIWDVALDLRPNSKTFLQWVGVELTAENGRAIYIPEGCAHGFQTLADDTEVLYLIAQEYSPESARGVRWDDPAFSIVWPVPAPGFISPRDRNYADFIL